jgi:hypothetical protein
MQKINYTFLALITFGLFLGSCQKKDNSDWSSEQDNALASELFQDIYKQLDEAAQSEGSLKSCATVTISSIDTVFPKTVTIDFGSGCAGTDGRTRSGSITAVFSGRWRDAGTVVAITPNNYVVNTYSVGGNVTITNNGRNTANNLSYSVAVSNGNITDANSQSHQWNGTTTYEWVLGESTTFFTNGITGITDDVYHITGSSSGVNRNGRAYTAVITERLVREIDCKWITDGTIEITPANADPRTINFGDGSCDAIVTLTFRNWTANYVLP